MSVDTSALARHPLWRRALAEFLGTGLLVTVIVGSGIAAQTLSTDPGLQLLENAVATALGLGVLIVLFAPISRAHFNPVVSLVDRALERPLTGRGVRDLVAYLSAQVVGAIGGAILANAMFATPTRIAGIDRATAATILAECVATAGLVLLVFGLSRTGRSIPVVATGVGAYIGAAYWFTSSTSFANPAVTIGRIFTDTFAGIAPASAVAFLGAQLLGAAIGAALTVALFPRSGVLGGPPSAPPSTEDDDRIPVRRDRS
ncbi:aquaporin [Microbacterium telephonicum]|uniref:Glycerol uptake facilitator-like aquaporin n=1 Tax=Microbacterium telephonicum TaxID=1714841 RepID=A0A498C9Q1_9MICO|nr:aquaporin [Microbacterium telephonicum]RLK49041.1 glycerol uptake facilitator-like aquaporin [Microbacterium telephonicum]